MVRKALLWAFGWMPLWVPTLTILIPTWVLFLVLWAMRGFWGGCLGAFSCFMVVVLVCVPGMFFVVRWPRTSPQTVAFVGVPFYVIVLNACLFGLAVGVDFAEFAWRQGDVTKFLVFLVMMVVMGSSIAPTICVLAKSLSILPKDWHTTLRDILSAGKNAEERR